MPAASRKKAAAPPTGVLLPPGALSAGPSLHFKPERRNPFEDRIEAQLVAAGIEFAYEGEKVEYAVPARPAKYLPDWLITGTQIIIEGKGWFRSAKERQKLVLVKASNPHLDVRIVFSDANKKIYKGSKTTYAKWADDHGFKWSTKGVVPDEWIEEIREELKRCKRSSKSATA